MQNRKLLMLNATIHDVPLILEARKQGFYVITTGNRPDFVGHQYANEYVFCDYSDYPKLVMLCKGKNISAVSCGTSDPAYYAAAYLGEYFGWHGHDKLDTIKILHNKGLFKKFTKEHGIQSPISEIYSDIKEALNKFSTHEYPLIIKPVDQAGGKGISVVWNREEYTLAISKAFNYSNIGQIVVEPYLDGSQHSLSTFLVDQKVRVFCSWDDLPYSDKYMISRGALPATYSNKEYIENKLISEVEKIASILKLVDGIFHLQFIVYNGEPYIIEVMRRCPGNWDTCMETTATGINWDQWVILAESGMDCHGLPIGRKVSGYWGYYVVLSKKNGVLKKINISNDIKDNIYRFNIWEQYGHAITNCKYDKLGLVHLWFSSEQEMKYKMKIIDDLVYAEVE